MRLERIYEQLKKWSLNNVEAIETDLHHGKYQDLQFLLRVYIPGFFWRGMAGLLRATKDEVSSARQRGSDTPREIDQLFRAIK